MPIKKYSLKLKCLNCNNIICSIQGGHWVCCSCFENKEGNKGIFMDRDRWFPDRYRIGGDEDSYEIIEE